MSNKTTSAVLVVLLALLVGYVVGTERAGSSPSAWAGPTQSATGFYGDYLIGNPETGDLVVWRVSAGTPVEASRYKMSWVNEKDAKGQVVAAPKISAQRYSPAEPAK